MPFESDDILFDQYSLKRYTFRSSSGSAKPPILFFHANGYSALTYQTLYKSWTHQGYDVYTFDFTGHGQSGNYDQFSDWFFFRDQAISLIDIVAKKTDQQPILIGHSIGGAIALLSSAIRNVAATVALDPVVLGPWLVYVTWFMDAPLAKLADTRRSEFKSIELVRKAFRRSPAFKDWDERVFEDYLSSCLIPAADGKVKLALPPPIEAKIFRSLKPGHWKYYKKIKSPVFVITAEKSVVCPPRSAKLLTKRNRLSRWQLQKGGSHLFVMESPDLVAEEILNFIDQIPIDRGSSQSD